MQKQKWAEMIQHYLDIREELKMIFLLVDCRHAPSEDDLLMLEWIRYFNKPFSVIATKADKIAITKVDSYVENLRKELGADINIPIFPFSSERKIYSENVWNEIDNYIN